MADVPLRTFQRAEHARQTVGLDVLEKIARGFKVSFAVLLREPRAIETVSPEEALKALETFVAQARATPVEQRSSGDVPEELARAFADLTPKERAELLALAEEKVAERRRRGGRGSSGGAG